MKFEKPVDRAAFSGRLRLVMKQRGLTQVKLAALACVTQPTVSFWLNESVPKPEMAEALARRLRVSPEWLLYGEGEGYRAEPLPSQRMKETPVMTVMVSTTESRDPETIRKLLGHCLDQIDTPGLPALSRWIAARRIEELGKELAALLKAETDTQ